MEQQQDEQKAIPVVDASKISVQRMGQVPLEDLKGRANISSAKKVWKPFLFVFLKDVGSHLRRAFVDCGFVYLTGHGVPEEAMERFVQEQERTKFYDLRRGITEDFKRFSKDFVKKHQKNHQI